MAAVVILCVWALSPHRRECALTVARLGGILRGFVGVTDLGWFGQLPAVQNAGRPPVEVNFWKPSEKLIQSLRPGQPFFIRLKSPTIAIGGSAFAVLRKWR